MKREDMLAAAQERGRVFDLLVIGGGATGLGIAVDAASRGHAVLLAERADFAQGTSSRSTKLIHGGVRYLQQGNVALVIEALKERGRLRRNAPGLVHDLAFVVPSYAWWESPFYGVGLALYDLLAGEYGFGTSRHLSREEVVAAIPNVEVDGLSGGTLYHDGQFDDARLALALAHTADAQGAVLLNYCEAVAFSKAQGRIVGAVLRDAESGSEFTVTARATINACGPWGDDLRRLDDPAAPPLLTPSQGTHLVLPRDFLAGDAAIMVPRTDDGRVIFIIPWLGRVLVGTTDTALDQAPAEPIAQREEIDFLLDTANRYLARDAGLSDIKSVFAGIRPLVSQSGAGSAASAGISREHALLIDPHSALLTVAGGKWTTYRRMAEDAVNLVQTLGQLPQHACLTEHLPLVVNDAPSALETPLHPGLPLTAGHIRHACRAQMARRVEDVLSRRSRCLLLDAATAQAIAPEVARLMADELSRDAGWISAETAAFSRLADTYLAPAI